MLSKAQRNSSLALWLPLLILHHEVMCWSTPGGKLLILYDPSLQKVFLNKPPHTHSFCSGMTKKVLKRMQSNPILIPFPPYSIPFYPIPSIQSTYNVHRRALPTLHMMYERIAPDEPIRAPTIVIRLLFNMKPSAHRAQPE